MENYDIISDRQEKVLRYLDEHGIAFTTYNHPEGKTIELSRDGQAPHRLTASLPVMWTVSVFKTSRSS